LEKAPDAFRTISEVADEIDVPQHVLRFWESRFPQIRPMKRGGGRRYYRPDDVDLLRGVRHLLYGEGYTIRGVQRILREQGVGFVQDVWQAQAEQPPPDLDEDRPAGDVALPSAAERLEPNLFSIAGKPGEAAPPSPPPLQAPLHAGPQTAAQAAPPRLGGEDRRKLQGALDELVACRRLIEAALSGETADAAATADVTS
jgi:DNA-binding transcriptional MerR regulator